jgi:hypothetical protein
MSATTDFSRRFFADFIASRIKARGVEAGATSPRRASVTDPSSRPADAPGQPAGAEAQPPAPRPDNRPHR